MTEFFKKAAGIRKIERQKRPLRKHSPLFPDSPLPDLSLSAQTERRSAAASPSLRRFKLHLTYFKEAPSSDRLKVMRDPCLHIFNYPAQILLKIRRCCRTWLVRSAGAIRKRSFYAVVLKLIVFSPECKKQTFRLRF